MREVLAGIWAYRNFILSSIKHDIVSRFNQSKLGGLWLILNPLAQVAIFAFILTEVLSTKLPGINNKNAYAIYLMAGTLGWTLFSEVLSRSTNVFIDNANLLKKVAFPIACLPLIIVGSAIINNMFLMLSVLGVYLALGHTLDTSLIWLLLLLPLTAFFAAGIGLILGVLNVFIRDVSQVVPVLMQFWYWLTPIVYMASILPEKYQTYLSLNPLYLIASSYQNVMAFNQPPNQQAIAIITVASLFLLLTGIFLYKRASPEMVDVL